MKPLEYLNNVERAYLLHQLFPQEIPRFLEFTEDFSQETITDREKIEAEWDNPMIPIDLWMEFAQKTADKIKRYGKKLHKSPRLFADQLFDGLSAIWMAHCLYHFTQVRTCDNTKFKLAVELLFVFHPQKRC